MSKKDKKKKNNTIDYMKRLKKLSKKNAVFNNIRNDNKNIGTEVVYDKEYKSNNKINQYELAIKIIRSENIIKQSNSLYKFNEKFGFYEEIDDFQLGNIVINNVDECERKKITLGVIKGTVGLLHCMQVNSDIYQKNKKLINCLNCVIDTTNFEMLNHDSKYRFFHVLNVKYDPKIDKNDFKKSRFNKFLKDITNGDDELKRLIQEIAGYSISNFNNAKKFFVIYGKPHCGKSVFLDVLTDIVGEENVSNIELQDLKDKRYIGRLRNKVVNICNELPSTSIKGTAAIKSLVSDLDSISYKDLYKEVSSFKNSAKLIFACNTLPSLENGTNKNNEAFFERIMILPFENSIPLERQDKDLINELKKEKKIIFWWLLKGLKRYIKNNYTFSQCSKSDKYLGEYIGQQSLIERFIYECIDFDENSYEFQSSIKKSLKKYFEYNGCIFNERIQKQKLKEILMNRYGIVYDRIHRNGENKHGFRGIKLKNTEIDGTLEQL